jgi:hypothetical protein
MDPNKDILRLFESFIKTYTDLQIKSKNRYKDLDLYFAEWIKFKTYLEEPRFSIAIFGRPRLVFIFFFKLLKE